MIAKNESVPTVAFAVVLACCGARGAAAADLPNSNANGEFQLQEIVVTAQKQSESLEKVPIAVSAITGESLRETGTFDPQGLTDLVPGVEVGYLNSNTTFAIRGISSTTDPTLGDAAVAFHLDGVFEGRPAAASGLFYDVARVEVLRGPQGTLYGRNATAGAINVVTNRPTFDGYSGHATVETGNYGAVRTEAVFNAPVSDSFAVRAAEQTLQHRGYLSDGYNDADDHALRLQALWKLSEGATLVLFGDYFHQGGVGPGLTQLSRVTNCDFSPSSPTYVGGAGYPNTPAGCQIGTGRLGPWPSWTTTDWTTKGYESPRGWTDNTSWSVHAELNLDLGPFVLTEIPAFHHLKVDYFALGNGLDNLQHDNERETSNELRLSSKPGARIKWVTGFFYHDEEQPYKQIFYDNVAGGMGAFSCAGFAPGGFGPFTSPEFANTTGNPSCTTPGEGVSLVFPYPKISNPSYALFGQATLPITSHWRATAGLRWNHDHKEVHGETDRVYGVGLPAGSIDWPYIVPPGRFNPGPLAGQTVYPGASEQAITTNANVTWTKTTWKVGLEHDLSEDSLLYANVGTGYKQGGVFAGIAPFNTYKPETLTAYEIGSKNRFWSNRLQLNADAFYYDYKDYQVDQLENLPVGNGTFSFGDDIFNAAKATEYGAELEARWVATPVDEFSLNFAWLHARFDRFMFPLQANPARPNVTTITFVDLAGVTPTSAPEFSGTLAYSHSVLFSRGSALQLLLQTHAESAYWLAVDHNVDAAKGLGSRQRGYTRSQATLTYFTPGKRFSVRGFVRNIENHPVMTAFSYGGDGPAYASITPPRTYGVAFEAQF